MYRLFFIFGLISEETFSKEALITKFLLREVTVCTSEFDENQCKFIKKEKLPDPDNEKIKILNLESRKSMIKVLMDGDIVFLDKSEVKTNMTRKTTKKCSINYEKKSEVESYSYGTVGMMDECYE